MWRLTLLLPILLLASGCSQDGPPRYRVSGSVAYGGSPVQAGQVIFEPDVSRGNSGPAGYAEIAGGKYQTLPDKGVVGGPHIMRVICLGGARSSELPDGGMLCPEHTANIDLPQRNWEHEIEVPSTLRW